MKIIKIVVKDFRFWELEKLNSIFIFIKLNGFFHYEYKYKNSKKCKIGNYGFIFI